MTPKPLQIRLLTSDDEPFLWDALYHAIHVPPGRIAPTRAIVQLPELARYVAGWMHLPADLGFVVEEAGEPIAAAWLRRWSGEERGHGFVDADTPELTISVLPGRRGRGVGTMLLRRLLTAAEERFAAVSLSVSESNPARGLYLREGFVPIGAPTGGSITMVKRFAPGHR